MVGIIDYGVGNLGSIQNILKKAGSSSALISDSSQLEECSHLVLPGVGAFDYAAKEFQKSNMGDELSRLVLDEKRPFLGICVGAQLTTKGSEEGNENGLGWFDAKVVRFQKPSHLEKFAVPHMGWNWVHWQHSNDLNDQLDLEEDPARFYFVHSYHFETSDESIVWGNCRYGYEFPCALRRDNIYAVQFHPEKSHAYGLQLMKNFLRLKAKQERAA